jgi:hypothetical protein
VNGGRALQQRSGAARRGVVELGGSTGSGWSRGRGPRLRGGRCNPVGRLALGGDADGARGPAWREDELDPTALEEKGERGAHHRWGQRLKETPGSRAAERQQLGATPALGSGVRRGSGKVGFGVTVTRGGAFRQQGHLIFIRI